ncbi:MAG: histidinol-phosphate transaminase [Candidatus Helarchaeota archaeon]
MNPRKLLSKNLKEFKPYTAGASLPDIARKLNITIDEIVKLDANENFLIDKKWLRTKFIEAVNRTPVIIYPDKYAIDAREALARNLKFDPDNLLIGNGSDDLLLTLYHSFTDTQSQVLTIHPTFSMYKWFANIMGCEYIEIPLKRNDFSLDIEKILSTVTKRTKLIIIPSPNNPTGNQFPRDQLLKIIKETESLVVIDEAYTDFSGGSLLDQVPSNPNLIILKTFSKLWGLAGLRLGYAVASKEVINILRVVQVPFTTNVVSQALVPLMLEEQEYISSVVTRVIEEREWLEEQLSELPNIKVYPSNANFLLIEVRSGNVKITEIIEGLFEQGILIRDQSKLKGLENCARITVGTREMNEKLIKGLKKFLRIKN